LGADIAAAARIPFPAHGHSVAPAGRGGRSSCATFTAYAGATAEIYKIFEKGIRQMPDEEDREIWTRAPEIAVRKATVLAFFRGSRTVAEVKIDGVEYLMMKERDIMRVLVEGRGQEEGRLIALSPNSRP
jgi:hypothetical protein